MNTLRSLSMKLAIFAALISAFLWAMSAIFPGDGYGNTAIWFLAASALFITPHTNLSGDSPEYSTRSKFDYLMESAVSGFYASVLAGVIYMAAPYFSSTQDGNSIGSIEYFGLLGLGLSFLFSFTAHIFATAMNITRAFRTAR